MIDDSGFAFTDWLSHTHNSSCGIGWQSLILFFIFGAKTQLSQQMLRLFMKYQSALLTNSAQSLHATQCRRVFLRKSSFGSNYEMFKWYDHLRIIWSDGKLFSCQKLGFMRNLHCRYLYQPVIISSTTVIALRHQSYLFPKNLICYS